MKKARQPPGLFVASDEGNHLAALEHSGPGWRDISEPRTCRHARNADTSNVRFLDVETWDYHPAMVLP